MTNKQFCEIVDAVCTRPRLYTINGTFEEVVCFLDGFGLGSNLDNKQTHSIWTEFGLWLARVRKVAHQSITMSEFRSWFDNDEAAILELARAYREYASR